MPVCRVDSGWSGDPGASPPTGRRDGQTRSLVLAGGKARDSLSTRRQNPPECFIGASSCGCCKVPLRTLPPASRPHHAGLFRLVGSASASKASGRLHVSPPDLEVRLWWPSGGLFEHGQCLHVENGPDPNHPCQPAKLTLLMSENLPFQGKSLQRSSDTECLELAETPQVKGTVPNKTVLAPAARSRAHRPPCS